MPRRTHFVHPVDLAAAQTGGIGRLASGLKITPQAVYKWRNTRIPAERVIDVERLSGVPRHVLRPDLHPRGHIA